MSEMHKRHMLTKKVMALFLLVLILSLPLVSAMELGSVQVRGQDGIENVAAQSDVVSFEATVLHGDFPQYSGVDIQQRLRIGTESEPLLFPFDNCVSVETGKTVCTFENDVDHDLYFTKYDYRVSLYNTPSKGTVLDRVDESYFVDSQEPSISFDSLKQNGASINISFTITDTLSNAFSQRCSGISSIQATFDGETKATYDTTGETSCTISDSVSFPLATTDTGVNSICLVAVDGVGNDRTTCRSFTVDLLAPTVDSLAIVNSAERPISFISTQGGQYKIQAKVSGEYDKSTAVFSYNGEERVASCVGATCETAYFTISSSVDAALGFSVSDKNGNDASLSKTQSIKVDTTGPSISSITTSNVVEGIMYVSSNGQIIATLSESESGFFSKTPSLTISGMTKLAESCTNSGSSWTCTWPSTYFSFSDGSYEAVLSGTDDAGNAITGGNRVTVLVDTTSPDLTFTAIYGESELTTDTSLFIAGGKVVMNFTFTDVSPITYFADFSEIGGAVVAGRCDSNPCQVKSATLTPGGERGIITFDVKDLAGNNDTYTTSSLYVLRDASDSEGDYFTHSLTLTPSQIETSTSDYLNQRAYAVFKARPNDGFEGQITSVGVLGCQNPQGSGSASAFDRADAADGGIGYVQGYEQVDLGTPDEVGIAFTFKATSIRDETITFDCDIAVSGIADGAFVSSEVEVAKVQFTTYELALGGLPENYESEVQAAIEDALDGALNKIASFKKWFDFAVKLCQLLGLWKTITSLFSVIGVGLAAIGVAGTPYTSAIGVTGSVNYCTGEINDQAADQAANTFSTICQYVTCEKTLWDLGGSSLFGGGSNGRFEDAAPAAPSAPSGAAPATGAQTTGGSNIANPRDPSQTFGRIGESKTNSNEPTRWLGGLSPMQAFGDSSSSRNNLVLSVINLCIPGILENLDKQRQIKCRYALCLIEDVPAGTPKQACDDAQEYSMCVYVYGQILGLLPIAFLNAFIAKIKAFFTSPMALFNGLLSISCVSVCSSGNYYATASVGTLCKTAVLLKQIGRVYAQITGIINTFKSFTDEGGKDYCEVLEDKRDAVSAGGSGSGGSSGSSAGVSERTSTSWG